MNMDDRFSGPNMSFIRVSIKVSILPVFVDSGRPVILMLLQRDRASKSSFFAWISARTFSILRVLPATSLSPFSVAETLCSTSPHFCVLFFKLCRNMIQSMIHGRHSPQWIGGFSAWLTGSFPTWMGHHSERLPLNRRLLFVAPY